MDAETRKLVVVLVPFPYQGHMTPILQLGSILHSKGFSIVVAHTKYNSPKPTNHPEFTFLQLEDNLVGHDTSFHNTLHVIDVMNDNCEAPFHGHMARLLEMGRLACVIYDSIMTFAASVANKLQIPSMVLRTNTAAFIQSHYTLFQLMEQNIVPIPGICLLLCILELTTHTQMNAIIDFTESQLQDPIPNKPPLTFQELPFPANREIPKPVLDFFHSYMNTRSASAVIWNTIDVFDRSPLQRLQKNLRIPFFPIGPFHKRAPNLPTSLMNEEASCLSWLDKQPPKSVIYVSFGSMAIIDEKELVEMAEGLLKSGQPFLWAIRPSLLNDSSSSAVESLPKDLFGEANRDRACVVEWAPQKKVLEHPAVGGFFTHCGWNSTLESICEGVPLLCRPCFSDQMINARYITDVWRIGIRLEGGSGSAGVDRAVRSLMVGEEGKEVRKRASEMKEKVGQCMSEGGSSSESLDRLVEFIVELSEAS